MCVVCAEGLVPRRESPLVVILRAAPLSEGELRDAALPALGLLRALHALCRHWYTLYRGACLPDHRPLVPNAEFINAKVHPTPLNDTHNHPKCYTSTDRVMCFSSPPKRIVNSKTHLS